MKVLLDEQLSDRTALTLSTMLGGDGHEVTHIVSLGHQGMADDDIPPMCHEQDITGLITANVKDFGARKHYFVALMNSGIHVAVVRPMKTKFDVGGQVGLIAPRMAHLFDLWGSEAGPTLSTISQGSVRERSLEELIDELG